MGSGVRHYSNGSVWLRSPRSGTGAVLLQTRGPAETCKRQAKRTKEKGCFNSWPVLSWPFPSFLSNWGGLWPVQAKRKGSIEAVEKAGHGEGG